MSTGSDWSNIWPQLLSAGLQSWSADKASDAQRAATEAGIAEQRRQYDTTRSDFAPWRDAGRIALGQLYNEMAHPVTAEETMQEPGYQFGLQQGQQGLDRKIAAAGSRLSGASLKAASRFNTDYATSGYNAAYQRRQDRLNRLASLAGLGQTATGSSAAAGTNSANQITNLLSNQGDASGAGIMAQGNIWGNALNQYIGQNQRQRSQPTTPGGANGTSPYYATWDNPDGTWGG